MPRLQGDQLAVDPARLVDAIDRDGRLLNTPLYKRWVPAYQWQWSSGMADFAPIGTVGYVAKMGKPSSLITSLRIDETWVKGDIYVTLYYSGSDNSGVYAIKLSGLAIRDDGSLDGSPSTVSDTLDPPSAANKLTSDTMSSFEVDANDDVFFLKLERETSGDLNSGNFYFVGGMLRFWPDRRV